MTSVQEPVLKDAQKYMPLGQVGMSQTMAEPIFPRVRISTTHDIRVVGERFYTHGEQSAHRTAQSQTNFSATATNEVGVTQLGESLEETGTLESAVPVGATGTMGSTMDSPTRRAPIVVDFEDRFVYNLPQQTNAQEAATRVYSINGILTKNNPFEGPKLRDGTGFGMTGFSMPE